MAGTIDQNALAGIEFELHWQCREARHTDCRFAEKVNFWRDIFPDGLESRLAGKSVGARVQEDYGPGGDPHGT